VAPTDAALGASIMSDRRVPGRIRRLLNVESGLNDGIATPFVNVFLAGALTAESISTGGAGKAAIALLGGAGLGAGIGLTGALLLVLSARRRWSVPGFRPLGLFAIALFAYGIALVAGTNGFVAAFVAGLAFGSVHGTEEGVVSFTEDAGTLLSLLVWFAFGAIMLVPGVRAADWEDLAFAVGALTVVRMVPVALALWGSGLDRTTVAFVGWFGPRGLASVVFGLIAVDSLAPEASHVVLGAVVVTVAMSVLAHGVTASPLTDLYQARSRRLHPGRPEHRSTSILPTRTLLADRRPTAAATEPQQPDRPNER
jgi:sodium/hydrogen antiporter